jgi:hypothetical protein
MRCIGAATQPPEPDMDKQPRNRIDDALNTILIVVGISAVLTLAIDAVRDDQAVAHAPAPQVTTKVATQPAAPAATLVAGGPALAAR